MTRKIKSCNKLSFAPRISKEILEQHCYYKMFNGVTTLTDLPDYHISSEQKDEWLYLLFEYYKCKKKI